MKVEVAVLGSLSLTVRTVSVGVKHNTETKAQSSGAVRASRGGRPGLPVSNS